MFTYLKASQLAIAQKYGLQKLVGCMIANNNSYIPQNELNELLYVTSLQFFFICSEWKKHFKTDTIKFYC